MAVFESLTVNEVVTPVATRIHYGTAAPTVGAYKVGDTVINTNPAGDSSYAWTCTVAGTPGTWQTIGATVGVSGVTSSNTELNKLTGATAVTAEFNTLTGLPATVTTTATPATGTCGVQFVFKDSAGAAITHAIAGHAYFSTSNGLAFANVTSAVVLVNGGWHDGVAGYTGSFISTAAGLLGVTLTAGTGTYYLSFQLPNGKIITSTALGVN